MNVGTICYDTSRGLGHLAHDFYLNGVVNKVCVVEHSSIPSNKEWYPDATRTSARNLNVRLLQDFCKTCDVMLFFETPFEWSLFNFCRDHKIKTVLCVMHECYPASPYTPKPDIYICPSLLDLDYFPSAKDNSAPPRSYSVFLPLPVDVKWRMRTHAEFFIHNGGYLGLRGREGTILLIEAMKHVVSPIRLRIRVQENVSAEYQRMCAADKRIEYEAKTVPYNDLFSDGDVYVAPQKFNGCSLPLQEAFASGHLVISTNRYPMNTWLPLEPLIPVTGYSRQRVGGPYKEYMEASVNPYHIAKKIDEFYGKSIVEYSLRGREWALLHSWSCLRSKYMAVLGE